MSSYFEPFLIWILHPDREEGPQWRRCTMSLMPHAGKLYLNVKIRRTKGGASHTELFESKGFQACIDRIFEDILRGMRPLDANDYREYPLTRSGRGAGCSGNGSSPHLTFQLPSEFGDRLENLSNHESFQLQISAKAVAAREESRRSKFLPSKTGPKS
jgi:hypothetical protein